MTPAERERRGPVSVDASEATFSDRWRWPAEWERHRATWLSWPHNAKTWPGLLARAELAFCEIVRALHGREQVCVNVLGVEMEEHVRARLRAAGIDADRGVAFFHIPTDDAWVRDHGPIFVVDRNADAPGRRPLVLDFDFDAWGRKYPPWDRDDAVPEQIANARELERRRPGHVLEGGAIDGNGLGTIMTTTSCLLNPNRSRDDEPRSREQAESILAEWLGAREVLWLGEGIEGDDTDGHVDDIARFVAPGCIVAAVERDPGDPNHRPLRDNLERLRSMKDQDGRPFAIVPLPMPPAIGFRGARCPASYANFYLANDVALVPTFDAPSDARALSILADCLPGREIVAIPSNELVVGLGAVHCLTQQEPE